MNLQPVDDSNYKKENIEYLKSLAREFAKSSRVARNVSFDEGFDSKSPDYILDCIFRCDGFFATIRYTSSFVKSMRLIIGFSSSDYGFTTYDILNLLGVDDFSTYEFDGCDEQTDIKRAFDRASHFVDTYGYDMSAIVPRKRLGELTRLYKHDREILYGDYWYEDEEYLENDTYTIARGSFDTKASKNKLIKKLEGMDRLTSFDERRLAYLKNNEDAVLENGGGNPAPIFKKTKRLVYIPIWIISFAVAIALYYVLKNAIFGNAFIISSYDEKEIGGFFDYIIDYLITPITLGGFMIFTIGKALVLRLCPSYARAYAKEKLYGSKMVLLDLVIPVVLVAIAGVGLMSALSNVGFADNSVITLDQFERQEYSYSDVKLYRVTSRINGEGIPVEFEEGDVYYYVGTEDTYYSVPMVYENDDDDKRLKGILKDNNVDIIELDSIEQLEEIYDN